MFPFQENFISLALAFKTDKMTLEKRIELHERSRDIAEQNVDKELEGLNEALKVRVFCSRTLAKLPKMKGDHHFQHVVNSKKSDFAIYLNR